MKIQIFILIAMCMIAVSCKTTKSNLKADVEEKTAARVDKTETTETIRAGSAVLDISNNVKTDEMSNLSGTWTKWSRPDEQGRQFPEETGTFTAGTHSKKDDQTKTNSKQDNSIISQQKTADKSDYKSDIQIKTDEKNNTKTKSPSGVSWGMVILTLGILFLIYLVLKRYKIL